MAPGPLARRYEPPTSPQGVKCDRLRPSATSFNDSLHPSPPGLGPLASSSRDPDEISKTGGSRPGPYFRSWGVWVRSNDVKSLYSNQMSVIRTRANLQRSRAARGRAHSLKKCRSLAHTPDATPARRSLSGLRIVPCSIMVQKSAVFRAPPLPSSSDAIPSARLPKHIRSSRDLSSTRM